MAMRDTTSWITENCDLNDDCDGTPPEDHLFPPEGRRVTFLAAEESRLIGGNQQDEETFVAIAAGTAVNVVIVDPDIHMVGVLLPDGQRVWAEPGNLTNTVTAIEVSPAPTTAPTPAWCPRLTLSSGRSTCARVTWGPRPWPITTTRSVRCGRRGDSPSPPE